MTHPIPAHLRAAVALAQAGYAVTNALAVHSSDHPFAVALLYADDATLFFRTSFMTPCPPSFVVRYDALPAPAEGEHPALPVLRAVFSETTP